MVMSLTDRLKGMISVALLNQVVKLVEEGDDKKACIALRYHISLSAG